MTYESKTDGTSQRSVERQQRLELERIKRAFWSAVQRTYEDGNGPWTEQVGASVPESIGAALSAIVEIEYRLTDTSLSRSIGITDLKLNDAAHYVEHI